MNKWIRLLVLSREIAKTFFDRSIADILCHPGAFLSHLGLEPLLYEVAILSQYQAAPREGHIKQAIRIFAYLEKKQKITLYMDHRPIDLDLSLFVTKPDEFKEYYRTAKEEQPHDMPRPRGRAVTTSAYVDSSHGANKVTRRSHSGHILFVNRAPVKWVSRRQNTVETSAFSSEFIAMKLTWRHCASQDCSPVR